ncbi:glycosyltransferase family 4 protein [Bacteroides togonis]|uniref:glycosyltransferase family 4 protein n=1 Tax=Bacteroides togonis TaxID=1917883 RepID=UPI00094B558E|nr:glycosyltransferase family 4 protein [Bacteroides togonis]
MKKIAFGVHSPAPYWNSIFDKIKESQNLTVYYEYYYDPEKGWKDFNLIPGKYYKDLGLWKLMRDLIAYDYVILGGWSNKWNIVIAFYLYFKGRKFAFFSDYPEKKKRSFLNQMLKKCLLTICSNLFVACEAVRPYYVNNYNINPSKVKLLHYSYSDIKDKENLRLYNLQRNSDLQHGSKINLYIASRFIERKGYQIVYKAFRMLKERELLDNFRIVITGSGPLYNEYNVLFSDLRADIKMLGWVENSIYEEEMNKCDVYLHPSLHEPFGIPPLDAMARGKLLVASNGVQSTISILQDKVNGLVYKADSAEQLFNALSFLINNKCNIYEISKNGIKTVQDNYSKQHAVLDLNDVLQS